jgi:hypothetical protein
MKSDRIILLLSLSSCLIFGGCSTTTPDERRANEERRRQEEANKREADEQRREQEQQQREQENLRRRFAKYSTAELKVMYASYSNLVQQPGTRDITVNPLATRIWGTSDQHNVQKLIDVERELLRRWQAGDAEAKLPQFDSITTSPK